MPSLQKSKVNVKLFFYFVAVGDADPCVTAYNHLVCTREMSKEVIYTNIFVYLWPVGLVIINKL